MSSAAGAGWQGLLLERHTAGEVHEARDTEAPSNILHFIEGVPLMSEWRSDGHTYRVVNRPGSMAFEPKGFRFDVHCVRGRPAPQWILDLDQTIFGQRVQETARGGRAELRPQLILTDPQIASLCRLLQADLEAGCRSGPLYGEQPAPIFTPSKARPGQDLAPPTSNQPGRSQRVNGVRRSEPFHEGLPTVCWRHPV